MTAKQEKLLASLLVEPTIEKAAKSAGLSEATALRYLKEDLFKAAYREARREVVSLSMATLQQACSVAVSTLVEIASNAAAPTGARVTAARAILDTSLKSVEMEDLAARVETLEALLKD